MPAGQFFRIWEAAIIGKPFISHEQTVREFACFIADLNRLADWLISCGVTTVARESTGVYWIPLFEILKSRGLELKLVNA